MMMRHTTTKKAQLQALETIIVSIILILLVLIGLWFYSGFSREGAERTRLDLVQEDINTLVLLLSELPELSCPDMSVETRNCIDKTKAELLSQALTNSQHSLYSNNQRLYYADLFGSANITISQRYPTPNPNVPNSIQLFDGATSQNVIVRTLPINLYDPLTNSIVLAEVEVKLVR